MIDKYAIYPGAVPGCVPGADYKNYSALPELWPRSEAADSPGSRFNTWQYSEATGPERPSANHASRSRTADCLSGDGQFSGALRYDDVHQLWILRNLQRPYFGSCCNSRSATGRESTHLKWRHRKYRLNRLAIKFQLQIKAERYIRSMGNAGQ